MEINDFVENFANQFDDTNPSEIKLDTVYKDLDEWSSLLSLTIIAMCDDEYSVKVTGDDIKKSTTVEDLYNLVLNRQ